MSSRLLVMLILFFAIHVLKSHADETNKLDQAISLLEQTNTGKEELSVAREQKIPIELGKVSKTDITATRVLKNDQYEYQFVTHVIVDRDKETVFQALDLAHELVHATHPKSNPFDPNLDATAYITSGIEGEGGEAQAIRSECVVAKELIESPAKDQIKAETIQVLKARCQFVWNHEAKPSAWKQSFYFLGQHYHEFMKSVLSLKVSEKVKQDWLEKVESKSPIFSSAVAHKPYPLALLEEYVSITHEVCKRALNSKLQRSVASTEAIKDSLHTRCEGIGFDLKQ